MGKQKKEVYDPGNVQLARYARALSHPARIEIVRFLAKVSSSPFHDVAREMPLANSTVSQHLDELKKAGLVQSTPSPPFVNYSVNRKNWKTARKLFNDFIRIKISKKQHPSATN